MEHDGSVLMKEEEIERLVAEHVMEWHAVVDGDELCFWKMPSGEIRTLEDSSFRSFRPFEDTSAAWEAVEKLEGEGFFWHAACTENGVTFIFYRGSESYIGDDPEPSCGHLAKAICRAALKAVGVEIDS